MLIRLPDDLMEALDERAAALCITRSQLIILGVRAGARRSLRVVAGLTEGDGTPRPELEEAVDEMMEAIREHRSRSEALEL